MGCWNETCALSRLPIFSGEPVVAIITIGRPTVAGECYYANDDTNMFTFPIRGKYDDYGSLEEDSIKMSDTTREFLLSCEFITKEGNVYKIDSWNEFFRDVNELKIESNDEDYFLGLMLVHQALWDNIVENYENREYYKGEGTPKEKLPLLYDNKVNRIMNDKKKMFDDFDNTEIKLSWLLFLSLKREFFSASILGPTILDFIDNQIILREVDPNNFKEEYVYYVMTYQWMNLSRFAFFSYSGMGSQSQEMMIQRIIAEFIMKYTDKKREEAYEFGEDNPLEETLSLPYDLR